MGAGAVGCFLGGKLAAAGETVTLIGRRALVEGVAAYGLTIETNAGAATVLLDATDSPQGVAGADAVLFCVKSTDTGAAGRAIAPYLRAGATVVCLQNGVDNVDRLAAEAGIAAVPAAVHLAAELAGPARVKHLGGGTLVLGDGAGSDEIATRFTSAGIPAEVSPAVVETLWHKLVLNCAYNALSAIAQLPCGPLRAAPHAAALMDAVVDECLAVAAGLGITLPPDMHGAVAAVATRMPMQYSSTAQDITRGRPTEIDHLNGVIVRKAAELGIAAPANLALLASVKAIEQRMGAVSAQR